MELSEATVPRPATAPERTEPARVVNFDCLAVGEEGMDVSFWLCALAEAGWPEAGVAASQVFAQATVSAASSIRLNTWLFFIGPIDREL